MSTECVCTCTTCKCILKTPDWRGVFLRKVFSSLTFQVVLTVLMASIIVYVPPVANFLGSIRLCLVFYIGALILPYTVMCHRYIFDRSHPVRLFSLGVFTAVMCFAVGLTCSFTKGFYFQLGGDPKPDNVPILPQNENPSSPVQVQAMVYERTHACCYYHRDDVSFPSDDFFPLHKIILLFIWGGICGFMIYVWLWHEFPATREPARTGGRSQGSRH